MRRDWKDVQVGEAMPALEFEMNLTALVMYAGATWDFHRYHYDARYVAERGMRAPFVDGQMIGALLARVLMEWGGSDAFLHRLGYRLRAMVFEGDRIVLSGRVVEKSRDAGRALVGCALDVVKADGTMVVGGATAALELVSTA